MHVYQSANSKAIKSVRVVVLDQFCLQTNGTQPIMEMVVMENFSLLGMMIKTVDSPRILLLNIQYAHTYMSS